MAHIKKIYIEGFKKFKKLDFDLNMGRNIIVGENKRVKVQY